MPGHRSTGGGPGWDLRRSLKTPRRTLGLLAWLPRAQCVVKHARMGDRQGSARTGYRDDAISGQQDIGITRMLDHGMSE